MIHPKSCRSERGSLLNRHDFVSGIFLLAAAAFFVTKAVELGVGAFLNPEPGFVLFWASVILALLSIVLVAKSVIGKSGRTRLADSWRGLAWWNPLITLLLLCLYAFFLKRMGFLVAMCSLMALLYALGKVKPHLSIAGAVVTVSLAYVVFHFILQVPFPRGILGW
ncbi:MAG: tripartite tricarboxylate transporter TctB family protein [Desulfobacteraceae bacterium]|nr:MAG: tripartite tricarboxylate transporter TctB family protein [Desulfobacteraceae bacterium]